MLNKILIISGLLIVYLIPQMMIYEYETETKEAVNNVTVMTSLPNKPTALKVNGFMVPKIESLASTNQNFYEEQKLDPIMNNYLLSSSTALIVSGIVLMEMEKIAVFIKNRVRLTFLSGFFNFIKML